MNQLDITQVFVIATSVIGGATLIFRGLEVLTKLTKSEKDDVFVKKVLNFLVKISAFVALNQKK